MNASIPESEAKSSDHGWIRRLLRHRGFQVCVAAIIVVGVGGSVFAYYEFFRVVPQVVCGDVEEANRDTLCADEAEEKFKYGSLGAEEDRGVPYTIFHVLPRAFPDLLPGPGGYRAFGIPWEEGRELPVGFAKKTMGFPRITQNCAVCHAATYRTDPEAKPVLVVAGPSLTTDVQAFLDFLEAAANDPRFTADVLLPHIENSFDLSLLDKLIHRFLIIPLTRKAVLEQAEEFAWMRAHDRPDWGPGRDDPMNLTKFFMIEMEDDGTTGNADFPSIWNLGLREGHSLNWGGETQDPLAVIIDSALGLGAPPGDAFIAQMTEIRAYLRDKEPPPFPFGVDAAKAAAGEPIYKEFCGDCHEPGGTYFGKVVPIDEIGTDRERFDTWEQEHADATNRVALEMGVERKPMVKDIGYASQPLDGIWLRAPYLHNGAVPSLRDLLKAPEERTEVFFRGCDIYDEGAMGFRSAPPFYDCRVFEFDTRLRGNGNGGHTYGVDLSQDEKDKLLEYMKTL